MSSPHLKVIAGLTYSEQSQVFNRWLLPVYQTSFRWTGNRADAEDATRLAPTVARLVGVHIRLDHVAGLGLGQDVAQFVLRSSRAANFGVHPGSAAPAAPARTIDGY